MPDIMENGVTREIEYPELRQKLRDWNAEKKHWIICTFLSDPVAMTLIGKLTSSNAACSDGKIVFVNMQAAAVPAQDYENTNAKFTPLPPLFVAVISKEFLRPGELIRAGRRFGIDLAEGVAEEKPLALVYPSSKEQYELHADWLQGIMFEILESEQPMQVRQVPAEVAAEALKLPKEVPIPNAAVAKEIMDFMAATGLLDDEGQPGAQIIPRKDSYRIIAKLIDSQRYWTVVTAKCDRSACGSVDDVLRTLPNGADWRTCTLTKLPIRLAFINRELITKKAILDIFAKNPQIMEPAALKQHTGDIFVMGDSKHPPEALQKALQFVYNVANMEKGDAMPPTPPGFHNPEHN